MKFNRRVGRKEIIGPGVLYDRKYFAERNDENSQNLVKTLRRHAPTSSTCCRC